MTKEELIPKLKAIVKPYIQDEEAFNNQCCIFLSLLLSLSLCEQPLHWRKSSDELLRRFSRNWFIWCRWVLVLLHFVLWNCVREAPVPLNAFIPIISLQSFQLASGMISSHACLNLDDMVWYDNVMYEVSVSTKAFLLHMTEWNKCERYGLKINNDQRKVYLRWQWLPYWPFLRSVSQMSFSL